MDDRLPPELSPMQRPSEDDIEEREHQQRLLEKKGLIAQNPILTRLKESAEDATPGPWRTDTNRPRGVWSGGDNRVTASDGKPVCGGRDWKDACLNAAHIANMDPDTTLALLEVIKILHDGLKRTLREHKDKYHWWSHPLPSISKRPRDANMAALYKDLMDETVCELTHAESIIYALERE